MSVELHEGTIGRTVQAKGKELHLLATGFQHHLAKPIEPTKLLAVVKQAVKSYVSSIERA